jgi:hypothetical protein
MGELLLRRANRAGGRCATLTRSAVARAAAGTRHAPERHGRAFQKRRRHANRRRDHGDQELEQRQRPGGISARANRDPDERIRDGKKEVDWQRQRFSVAIPSAPPAQVRYEAVSNVKLEPGTYEIRVAIRHEQAGDVGSVHTYVDVPDFDNEPFTVSGVILHDSNAPTATPQEALGGALELAPTTRREFTVNQRIIAAVRAYERRSEQPRPVGVAFRVLDHQLREVVAEPISITADRFQADGSAEVRFDLPLGRLQPGAFVLRVEATRETSTVRREVPFSVR